MGTYAAPAAAAAKARALPAAGPARPAAAPIQAKLEVGPAHDRFEAEADRVAGSITSSGGPAAAPAISPLPAPGAASRRAVQREEKRPIEQREKKEDPKAKELGQLLQRRADPRPKPLRKPDEETLQTKPASPPPKPKSGKQEPDLLQTKPLAGTLQRDNVDDDTVLETSIQAKPLDGAVQRETVVAPATLQQAEPEKKEPPAPAPVQREATSAAGFTAPASVESGIAAMRGGGQPLPGDVLSYMEPRFGRDLSGVRVHDGARAGDLAGAVHAKAFTIGQDIFFGPGQYQPSTTPGRSLLAHELTHTVQQSGGSSRAQPQRIQRVPSPPTAPPTAPAPTPGAPFPHAVGTIRIDPAGPVLEFNALPVPQIGGVWKGEQPGATPNGSRPSIAAVGSGGPWRYTGKTRRGSDTARQKWLRELRGSAAAVKTKIEDRVRTSPSGIIRDGQEICYLKSAATSGAGLNFLLIGTSTQLSTTDEILLPIWNAAGGATLFDVDHIHELQLGGADAFPNFWLLEQGTNRSSGSNIASAMKADFDAIVGAARTAGFFTANSLAEPVWDTIRGSGAGGAASAPGAAPGTPAAAATPGTGAVPAAPSPAAGAAPAASSSWTVQYLGKRTVPTSGTSDSWTKQNIIDGTHLAQLVPLSQAEIMQRGLVYAANPTRVTASFYALDNARGGFYRQVDYSNPGNVRVTDNIPSGSAGSGTASAGANQFYRGFSVGAGGITMAMTPPTGTSEPQRALLGSNIPLSPGQVIATVRGQPFTSTGKITQPAFGINIKWHPDLGYGGYADRAWINELMGRLSIHGASPIAVQEAGLSPQGDIFATGEILATKALFPNLRIPIMLRGNEVFVRFPIPTDRLSFGPVRITDAAIDIGFGEHGIFLGGSATVVVDNVGSGTITARTTADDTILEGTFNFTLNFLNPASARLRYSMANDTLDLTLNAGVREGVLPGVTSGTVTGHFSRDVVELGGTLNLAPPLAGSTVTVGYTRETGLTIAATNIPLPVSNIPGITDATLSARANYNPDDGQWRLSGTGSARFSIPPATGMLTVSLDGPVVTIHGTAAFQQGIASGSLEVNATNARLDEAGQPVPGQVANAFTITGRGSASLRFGILTGTAGIELTRDGRVIVSGEIALPPTHEVFARRSYNRELLHVAPPEFPIWGVSLGGIGIGIFAFCDARLSFDAFVGPGTLQNTAVHATFELAKPEEAVVDGNASFVVPAGAGFTLDIGGGLRARAAVAYVQGRVGLDARLGLLAEARADVHLHWTPSEGLSLTASAHAEARPQFEVGVNASVTAGVDLLLTSIDHTWGPWRRQLGSFGPELAVGVTVPIAWSERTGLDFNTDRIEITRPDIDFGALMTDGFMQLV
ncbi:MAG: DUF4157 domain-containing protein [Alphaproteobacteria bacterium]|nr:DUF4157 domain-containing protein [Alphaproteobacteria bacterium]MBV9373201.1 DUF4157 domain-containing protein [Alphaproteobacteria bacterium]MBV9900290.1 DUF4157 domain-containing protein [Alphaproteobacteria bacterium]